MSEKKLILTVGLPRSGKTTHARELMAWNGYPIVSPDAIRLAMGHRFYGPLEPLVWAHAKLMVRALFAAGHDTIIIDATNVSRKRRDEWKGGEWVREFHVIATPVEVCLRRALGDPGMGPVIKRMCDESEAVGADEGPVVQV